MTDDELMALSAIRYCCGRKSYMSAIGASWMVRQFDTLSRQARVLVVADVVDAIAKGSAGDIRIDEPEWRRAVSNCLVKMQPDEVRDLRIYIAQSMPFGNERLEVLDECMPRHEEQS